MGVLDYKFRSSKTDQSPYLFHFTKGDIKTAKDALHSILNSQKLVSAEDDYVCFTASPITSLHKFFQTKVYKSDLPMYQPYGIGFKRDILIDQYNARNVVYCGANDFKLIPEELYWRRQLLSVNSYDFEYLREWRIKGKEFDFSSFPKEEIVIVAPIEHDIFDLVVGPEEVPYMSANPFTGEMYTDTKIEYQRMYKDLSMEAINNFLSDYSVSNEVNKQILYEDMFEALITDIKAR